MQRLLDLLHAAQDLLRRESPPLVVLVNHDVHEGVLLGVDHGPEDVVPEGEGEGPVSAELGLHSTLHGGRPVVDGYLGRRLGFLALLLAGGSFRFSAAVLVFWTSGQAVPCLKQKQKAVAK